MILTIASPPFRSNIYIYIYIYIYGRALLYGFYVFVSINTNCLETKLKERKGEGDYCLKNGHMWLLSYDMGIISFLWQLKIIIK